MKMQLGLRAEAMQRASKMSIQGVRPKLSAILNIKDGLFEIVDKSGRYILKPQHHIFPELPQNEDLTMRLAASIGIEVPLHGLIYSKDSSLTYFIRRFDRKGQKDNMHLKNYSIIIRNGKVELSPAYDLLNSSIVLKGDIEEIALSLKGKKSNLNRDMLVNYFGKERCSLTDKIIERILETIQAELPS
ncbi:MAG: HipA domain-containing protein, partial [Bacteroidota bacterium]|nr:HipA domain-containing protein [Bacteroidota bacterium]